jgi:HEAT repeat protein
MELPLVKRLRLTARHALVFGIGCCAPIISGCNAWLANGPGLSDKLAKSERAANPAADNRDEPEEKGSNKLVSDGGDGSANDVTPAQSGQQFAELAVAEWVLAPAEASDVDRLLNPFAEPNWPARRWRHAGVETILSREDAAGQLKIAAGSRDQTIAINAAIGLSQLGNSSVTSILLDAALSAGRPRSMRGAAIESLAFQKTAQVDAAIQRLADELGRWEGNARARYNPELHGDVIRAIGLRRSTANDAALAAALGSPSAEVRCEAARAYERLGAIAELPRGFIDLVADESAKVRAAAVRALVACRHSAAQIAVERALTDEDLGARIAAVHALAELGGAANHDRLVGLLDDSVELIRAAAVRGLVRFNDVGSAAQAADDKSWRVRLALAASLAEMPPRYGSPIAVRLIGDADLKVQRRAVESAANWPMADCIPLLLLAAEQGSVLTRREAIQHLQHRWPAAQGFPQYASGDRQLDEIKRLKQVWQTETNATTVATEHTAAQITAEDEQRAIAAVTALAIGSLGDRREAARKLAVDYQEKPIPPAAIDKLWKLIEAETDGLIWIDVMSFVARAETPAAAQVAAAAASHANPEVRRRACAWFGAHASDRGAEILINSLADNDASVVRAAVQALGMQRQVTDLRPLEGLLSADDHTLRVVAAESLARLGSPAGFQALSRLTYDREARVCRMAATAIGNVYGGVSMKGSVIPASTSADKSDSLAQGYQSQFVTDLMRLLDGRAEVRRAAVLALANVTGERPPKTSAAAPSRSFDTLPQEETDTAAAVAWWKKRFAHSQAAAN